MIRLKEHPTLEEDVYTFVTHAKNFREILLRLLHQSILPVDHDKPKREELTLTSELEEQNKLLTKQYYERLLE
eukprot:CAMPEP_0183457778 /NCGR_PEP_ID=MMETSP0370-20130417/132083_1 /TAXON_ID=268820 /ORGANISM="Peridinium aciculiferum, Strain PAER-2" /LENGTH=72 /DNA_ID=CAMNT_0025649515 /DNA_START=33 /DNA_END=248 /DNA_ORIENTATION=+